MAAGVPVIASATVVHRYYYDDSLVHFFHDDSVEELASCILFLKEHPEIRTALIANGAAYVRENNWAAKSSEYLAIVDGLISSRANRCEVVADHP
jgi:glycosyltransferase involved in cell wall biosynthesis